MINRNFWIAYTVTANDIADFNRTLLYSYYNVKEAYDADPNFARVARK